MKPIYWLTIGLQLSACTKKNVEAESSKSSLNALNPKPAAQAPLDPVHAGMPLVPHAETGEVRTPYQPNPKEQRMLAALAEEGQTFGQYKQDLSKGKAAFKMYCASCHGENGQGGGPAGDSLAVAPTNFHEWPIKYGRRLEDIAMTIKSGRNDQVMPSFGAALNKDEIWALSYLVSSWIEARKNEPTP